MFHIVLEGCEGHAGRPPEGFFPACLNPARPDPGCETERAFAIGLRFSLFPFSSLSHPFQETAFIRHVIAISFVIISSAFLQGRRWSPEQGVGPGPAALGPQHPCCPPWVPFFPPAEMVRVHGSLGDSRSPPGES